MWRGTIQVLTVLGASLLSFSASAFDESAPFGFSWGPLDKVPAPSLATRHTNITLLIYRRDRLPHFKGLEDARQGDRVAIGDRTLPRRIEPNCTSLGRHKTVVKRKLERRRGPAEAA